MKTLTERINKLCKIFDKSEYLFSRLNSKDILIRFEKENEESFEFRGSSMYHAVKEAEEYAKHEMNVDILKEENIEQEDQTKKEKPSKNDRQLKLPF